MTSISKISFNSFDILILVFPLIPINCFAKNVKISYIIKGLQMSREIIFLAKKSFFWQFNAVVKKALHFLDS